MTTNATPRPLTAEEEAKVRRLLDLALEGSFAGEEGRSLLATLDECRAQLADAQARVRGLEEAITQNADHDANCRRIVLFGEYNKGRSACPDEEDLLDKCDCWLRAALAAKDSKAPRVFTRDEARRIAQSAMLAVLKFVKSLGLDEADVRLLERGEHATFMGIINRRIDEVAGGDRE